MIPMNKAMKMMSIITSFKNISEVDNNRHKNNLKQVQHHQYNKINSPNRRPQVVLNRHPEKQTVFTRPRTVPGDRSYSDAARIEVNKSNNTNIKIFSDSPAGIYLLKVNNRNTRTRCEICSKLTIKTPERRH